MYAGILSFYQNKPRMEIEDSLLKASSMPLESNTEKLTTRYATISSLQRSSINKVVIR